MTLPSSDKSATAEKCVASSAARSSRCDGVLLSRLGTGAGGRDRLPRPAARAMRRLSPAQAPKHALPPLRPGSRPLPPPSGTLINRRRPFELPLDGAPSLAAN